MMLLSLVKVIADKSTVRAFGIHLRVFSQDIMYILDWSLNIISLR